MKYNKDISNLARELVNLGLSLKERRELIKETHTCPARIFGFPEALENAIKEAKKGNINQGQAYNYLRESLQKYDNEIASEIAYQKNSSFNTNNQSSF